MPRPTHRLHRRAALLFAFAATLAMAVPHAGAQTFETGFAQFGSNSAAPIEIEADALEVQDRANIAVFTGNVVVKQEGAALETARLTVHYAARALPEAGQDPTTPQNQRISRLEAEGGVIISADGQSATGDTGEVNFDARTISLNGGITLNQEGNVVTGDTLTVSLDTGVARVTSQSRVRVLLTPGGN